MNSRGGRRRAASRFAAAVFVAALSSSPAGAETPTPTSTPVPSTPNSAGGGINITKAMSRLEAGVERYARETDEVWRVGGRAHDEVELALERIGGQPWGPAFEAPRGEVPTWVAYVMQLRRVASLVANRDAIYRSPSEDGAIEATSLLGVAQGFIHQVLPPGLRNRPEVRLLIDKLDADREYLQRCRNGIPPFRGGCDPARLPDQLDANGDGTRDGGGSDPDGPLELPGDDLPTS